METVQYFATKGAGEIAYDALYYATTLKVGNTITISGQGGWDDNFEVTAKSLEEEIEIACNNVETALNAAGASWEDVVSVQSYHVGMERTGELMPEQFRKRISDHRPLWTGIGVDALALPTMHVEIVVTAIVKE